MEKLHNKLDSYERKLLSPEYLEMTKKENEILILRAENLNLKNSIAATEKNLETVSRKFSEYKAGNEKASQSNQELISQLSKKLNDLNKKHNLKLEESSLIESSTNSLSENNGNSKHSTNFSKCKTNSNSNKRKCSNKNIVALTGRISNNDSSSNLGLCQSERKVSGNKNPLGENEDFDMQNELLNAFMAKDELINKNKFGNLVETENTQIKKECKYRAYSNIFEKINKENLKAQKMQKENLRESHSIDKNV